MSYFDDIRSMIAARLEAKNVAEGRVNESPVIPGEDDELPAANVYTLSGSGDRNAANANHFDAELTATIDLFDTASTDPALAAAIAGHIDAALDAVMTDHELAARFKIERYSFETDLDVEAATRLAAGQIKLTGRYLNEYEFTFDLDLESVGMAVKHAGRTAAEVEVDLTEE